MVRIALFLLTNLAIVLVLSLSMRLLGVGSSGNSLIIMALIFGFGGSLISLLISKWSALRMTGAEIIEQPRNATEAWLLDTVRHQAQQAGIGQPDFALYDSSAPNAFATGANRNHALIAVSSGLLESMTAEEVEAVLAHEVSHVANGDMVTLTLIQGVVNTFVIIFARLVGHFVDRILLRNESGQGIGYWIASTVAELVLGIAASMIVLWFSRQREFRADAGGARLAGRGAMIAALQRLQQMSGQASLPPQMAALGVTASSSGLLAGLLLTHPPLADRIAALQQNR